MVVPEEFLTMQHPMIAPAWTRRDWLRRMGGGFGALGLAGVLASEPARAVWAGTALNPLAPKAPHFAPRAKRVIFLFMNGGPSHVDTFDPKPLLGKHNGERPPEAFRMSRRRSGTLMGSPFSFRKYGESGIEVSELYPELAKRI